MAEFKWIKVHSKSTLMRMKKSELADYAIMQANNANTAYETLEQQAKNMKDFVPAIKWIDVEDRLPEQNKIVILYLTQSNGKKVVTVGKLTVVDTWRTWLKEYCFEDVANWMPLPEPPKE